MTPGPLAELKTGWWSFSLPGYREHPKITSYSLFPFDDLPPLEAHVDVNWRWLQAQPVHEQWSLAENGYPDGSKANLSQLGALLDKTPFALPPEFTTFMESPSLHNRIRSCTACLLELSDIPVFTSAPPDGVIIQFLVDQQSVLRWHLFADAQGRQAVLVSGEIYGLIYDPIELPRNQIDLFQEEFWLCAPSFSDFIVRFWLENEIWFTLFEGKQPATGQQRAYLNHYR